MRVSKRILGAAFVDSLGTGMVSSVALLYFAVYTTLDLGVIGLCATLAALISLPVGLLAGAPTDRFGARSVMVANNIISAVGFGLYFFAGSPVIVLIALLLTNCGDRIYWSVWTSYIHDLTGESTFELTFAKLESSKMAGMGSASLIASIIVGLSSTIGIKCLILINVLLTVSAAIIYALGPTLYRVSNVATRPAQTLVPQRNERLRVQGFYPIIIGQLLLSPIMVLPNVALSVYLVSYWGMGATIAPLMFGINVILVSVFQMPLSKLLLHSRRSSTILAASLVVVVIMITFMVLPPLHGLLAWLFGIAVAILLGVVDMLYMPSTNAIMALTPPRQVRGRSVAAFQTAMACGMSIYPLVLGLLEKSAWIVWAVTGLSVLGGAIAYVIATRHAPPEIQYPQLQSEPNSKSTISRSE